MNPKDREHFFLEVYDKNADALFRFCYFKLFERELAKDVVQETFMRIWRQIIEGQELLNPRAFMYTVAGNLIKDHWKKKRAVPMSQMETGEEEISFDVPDESLDYNLEAEVKLAVRSFGKLADSDREILTLRYIQGLSPKDIADILGERDNTISVRLNRAVERLRKIINR